MDMKRREKGNRGKISFVVGFVWMIGMIWLTIWCNLIPNDTQVHGISDLRLRFLSTSAVLEATLNRNAAFFHFTTDYPTLIKAWKQNSKEFRELLRREDAAEVIFACYKKEMPYPRLKPDQQLSQQEEMDFHKHQSRLEELEFLLSLEIFQDQLSEAERNMLPQLVKEKLILKRNCLELSHVSWYQIKENGDSYIPDMSYLYFSSFPPNITESESLEYQQNMMKEETGWQKFYDAIYKKSSRFSCGSFDSRLHTFI